MEESGKYVWIDKKLRRTREGLGGDWVSSGDPTLVSMMFLLGNSLFNLWTTSFLKPMTGWLGTYPALLVRVCIGSSQHCEDVRILRGREALLHRHRVSIIVIYTWYTNLKCPHFKRLDVHPTNCDYFSYRICKGGELFDEIIARGKFSEKDAAVLMKQILQCVNYCHSNHIVHR